MTAVTLPNGDDAEASFTVTTEKTDNGMDGPYRQDWLEVSCSLDSLMIVKENLFVVTISRETAVARYGDDWVCGIEEDEAEKPVDDDDGQYGDDWKYENRREERE